MPGFHQEQASVGTTVEGSRAGLQDEGFLQQFYPADPSELRDAHSRPSINTAVNVCTERTEQISRDLNSVPGGGGKLLKCEEDTEECPASLWPRMHRCWKAELPPGNTNIWLSSTGLGVFWREFSLSLINSSHSQIQTSRECRKTGGKAEGIPPNPAQM